MFIRLNNSDSGYFDVDLGQDGQVLVSNGISVAPSFQDPPTGLSLRTFSYTQDWELTGLESYGGNNFGIANFTSEFERSSAQGTRPHGPASYTTPSDIPWTKRV